MPKKGEPEDSLGGHGDGNICKVKDSLDSKGDGNKINEINNVEKRYISEVETIVIASFRE